MTLNKTIAKLGEARIQQAINDQREWMPASHSEVCRCFAEYWKRDPRGAVRWLQFAAGMAGFKSYTDTYLLMAFALGKLPFVK